MKYGWRESVESRKTRSRRTALGETIEEPLRFQSPPPQAGPTIDGD